MTRLATMTYALLLSCVLVFGAAPAAHAQLLDGVGDLLDGGSNGGGGSSGGSGSGGSSGGSNDEGSSGGSGGGLIGGVIGGILDDDGDNSSNGSDGGEPSNDGGLIGGVVDTIDKVTDPVKEPVKDVVDETKETVDRTSDGLSGGYVGGIKDAVNNAVDRPRKVVDKIIKGDKRSDDRNENRTTNGPRTVQEEVFGENFRAALDEDQRRRTLDATAVRPTSATEVEEPAASVVQQIGRVAAEAAEQMAFPVMLLLMVGAFLLGQNRVDRRDPKLALAPVDVDADLLTFT